MDVGKLTVEYRNNTGKNIARRLRAEGKVPGICYGLGSAPMPIALEPRALKRALDPQKRQNTVITMTVTGAEGGERTMTVMLKEYQVNSLRQEVEHVDLVQIDPDKEVTTSVPIEIVGKPMGAVDGGQLHTNLRALSIISKPADIPVKIQADVSNLDIGDALHVSELKLPNGVRLASHTDESVASCVAPQAEKAAATTEATPAEGAAPAAGAAAAAPAKGGDAKAAPAKGGDAKAAAPAAKGGAKK